MVKRDWGVSGSTGSGLAALGGVVLFGAVGAAASEPASRNEIIPARKEPWRKLAFMIKRD
jgi:hypothetical protein